MEFKRVDKKYVDEAVELSLTEYKNECEKCKDLIISDYKEKLKDLITELFKSKYGLVAIEDNKLMGYISFYPIRNEFFGKCRGVFSPLGGNAFIGNDRNRLSSLLVEKTAQILVDDGITSIAICRYANDYEIEKSLVFNGFGIRCSDGIRKLNRSFDEKKVNNSISYCEIRDEKSKSIYDLKKGLVMHMSKSPIFFVSNIPIIEDKSKHSNNRIFVAKDNDEIIGFIEIGLSGETFITKNNYMRSISGTYLKPQYRGRGISLGLLSYVCEIIKKDGIIYLGVDCETLNPTALRFWGKYFENYTYSFHRRIDERIIGYNEYLEKEIFLD